MGGSVLDTMHDRSRVTIDPRIPCVVLIIMHGRSRTTGGGGAYSFVACLSHLVIDRASLFETEHRSLILLG